jgi:tetratricopeptide (TPR) repeat protein
MLKKDMSKSEINSFLENKNEFTQIDYLNKYIELNPTIELKHFAFLKLSRIYEKKGFYSEAGKNYENAANYSINFSEKVKNYVKGIAMFIKSKQFERAEQTIKKALYKANENQKKEIYSVIKKIYKNEAENCEKNLKRNNAAIIYEKLIQMNLSDEEKKDIKNKLSYLYEKLGKFNNYSLK